MMISYEKAVEKAKSLKPNIDNCREHTDAYIFFSHADDMTIGGDGPVVIVKETGEAINMPAYLGDFSGTFVIEIAV